MKKILILLVTLFTVGLTFIQAQDTARLKQLEQEITQLTADFGAGKITAQQYQQRMQELQGQITGAVQQVNTQANEHAVQKGREWAVSGLERFKKEEQELIAMLSKPETMPRLPQGETIEQVYRRLQPRLLAQNRAFQQLLIEVRDSKVDANSKQFNDRYAVLEKENDAIENEFKMASIKATPPLKSPPAMLRISGGTFMMGSPENEPERYKDETQHRVTVSSFLIGKYEVTQREWAELMGTNPSFHSFSYHVDFQHWYGNSANMPVDHIGWLGAIRYCNAKSQKEGLTPCYTITTTTTAVYGTVSTVVWNRRANGYRLPTEAEWEYACRAGTTTPFYTGNRITLAQANISGSSYNGSPEETVRPHLRPVDVGSYPPNPWGLYDMIGNIWEVCYDSDDPYTAQEQKDPAFDTPERYRVARGGGYEHRFSGAFNWRSAMRGQNKGEMSDGFRVVRNAE